MSSALISFLFALGASGWVYGKLQNRSGRNTRQSLTATAVFAVFVFIIFYSLLSWAV